MTTIYGAVLEGIEAVAVKVSVAPGAFDVKGLPEAATRETRVRVRAAFAQLCKQPTGVVTVERVDGLPIGYGGAALDLAVAVAASGMPVGADVLFVGELSLMGEIRSVRGAVPMALLGRNLRIQSVLGPQSTLPVPIDMRGTRLFARHLSEVLDAVNVANLPSTGGTGEWLLPLPSVTEPAPYVPRDPLAWSDVAEHPAAHAVREAVENGACFLVLVGEAGSGRTMISRRIASLLPALTDEQRLDVDTIASAAGLEAYGARPFRAPHHTASTVAITGGGSGGGSPIRPGEVTIAHHGVLLVDEANEMPRASIEALLSTLKRGGSKVVRTASTTTMPARPAVTVISITLPEIRKLTSHKDVPITPITPKEQALLDARTKRCLDLADRFVGELGAVVIRCPRVDVRAMAQKAATP